MTDGTNKTFKEEYPLYKISNNGDIEKVVDIKQFKTHELVEELKSRIDVCKTMHVESDCYYCFEIASPIGELIQHEEDSGAALVLIIKTIGPKGLFLKNVTCSNQKQERTDNK